MKIVTIIGVIALLFTAVSLTATQLVLNKSNSTARSSVPGQFSEQELRFAQAARKVCRDKSGTWERQGNMIVCYKEAR